jgi:hypothetical protein
MQNVNDLILSGIHDDEDGTFASGWVAIKTGVTREEHGNHFHAKFDQSPSVFEASIDAEQGNPAHVYVYGGRFYLANDKKNGFTEVTVADSSASSKISSRFFQAGGGHITLAVVEGSVAYSTWIDRDGDNRGRVDVVGLSDGLDRGYSFQLPNGGIHGATTNSGRVFFAPSDGIYWVDADLKVSGSAATTQVQHLSLGDDSAGTALRTGAFVNHETHVLCLAGRGADSRLCMIDASKPQPSAVSLPMGLATGTSLSSLEVVKTRTGQQLALVVQESADGSAAEELIAIDLDPNRDGDFQDATVAGKVAVGRSNIQGHSGHHELAVLPHRTSVAITNPGDGSIWIISLSDFTVQEKLNVGGSPTRLVSVGA